MKGIILLVSILANFDLYSQVFTDSNLPIVVLTTENNQPIPDDPRITAHMGIIDNGAGMRNYLTDPFTNYDGRIEIEIRGSTSQQYPKKGYGFETQDSLGNKIQVAVLGMPPENDWILYGPYPDKTLIRNVLTFNLARKMGQYAAETRYCELVLNGNYRGVYVMMERIKRDGNRVNIEDIHIPNFWDDTITGGYVMKVDKLTGDVGFSWASNYNNEVLFQFHDPEYDELYPPQISYMVNYIDEFEDAIWGPNFNDPVSGYPYYIDVESFYDFTILQELGRTVDGYRSSSFFHKDRNTLTWNAKIVAGPMWDFNLSYGNADYCGADLTTGWQYNFDEVCDFTTSIPFWWERLLDDVNYRNGLRCRWEELRQGPLKTENVNLFIDSVANHLAEARIRNFERWPIIGVYVNWNGYVGQSYGDDLQYLKDYIEQRSLWIDQNLGGNCNLFAEYLETTPELHKVWPNPALEEIYVGVTLLDAEELCIEITDMLGKRVILENLGNHAPGKYAIPINLENLQSGNYLYRIRLNQNPLFNGKLIKK